MTPTEQVRRLYVLAKKLYKIPVSNLKIENQSVERVGEKKIQNYIKVKVKEVRCGQV